jgi:hypothetical protein
MGVFGAIKKVGKKIGKVATKAAPFVGMIPGVGTLAAAGIGAAGGLLSGEGLKGAAKYGALGAAGNIGANLLGKIPGVGFLADKGKNVWGFGGDGAQAATDLGGMAVGQGAIDPTYGDIGGVAGGAGGAVSALGKAAKGGGSRGVMDILGLAGKYAPLAMGAVGAYQNAQQASQNRELTEEQIKNAREAIARQRMLQDRALTPIDVKAPDFTNIFSQTQNPFYRPAQAGG